MIGAHEVELVIGKGVPVLNLADEMRALATHQEDESSHGRTA
ncbi:hypothetical protein [Xanthomonas prunicola]|nr:hypothetical protein [Xanthomonas prunicola]